MGHIIQVQNRPIPIKLEGDSLTLDIAWQRYAAEYIEFNWIKIDLNLQHQKLPMCTVIIEQLGEQIDMYFAVLHLLLLNIR